MKRSLRIIVVTNFLLVVFASFWFFVIPAGIIAWNLRDPGLTSETIPRFAFRQHAALAPRYTYWARDRIASKRAASLSTSDVSGTEWPMFGSVFFLWATESLQEAWNNDPDVAPIAPKESARDAIEAAADLIADPNHAAWVKTHWGEDYLDRQNLFYRMLLISGLTSYQKLSGLTRYQSLLAQQVESFAQEIDSSPHGLLDDYPGECYPIDVLPAIAAIKRADSVLHTDHSALIARAVRAFEGNAVDPDTGLPAYEVSSTSGRAEGPARGIGIAYMLIWAPEFWPQKAQQWYPAFEQHFWQSGWWLTGVREFPKSQPDKNWSVDVDAGPVIAGYGTAASAFGIGAALANSRFDHAYPLASQALAASWPLPDGTLLLPRLLSNLADAPYVGESALLFCLTRKPHQSAHDQEPSATTPTSTPRFVYGMILLYLGTGLIVIAAALHALRRWFRGGLCWSFPLWNVQVALWAGLLSAGFAAMALNHQIPALISLMAAQLVPRRAKLVPEKTLNESSIPTTRPPRPPSES